MVWVKKFLFEQRPEGGYEMMSHAGMEERCSRQRIQPL